MNALTEQMWTHSIVQIKIRHIIKLLTNSGGIHLDILIINYNKLTSSQTRQSQSRKNIGQTQPYSKPSMPYTFVSQRNYKLNLWKPIEEGLLNETTNFLTWFTDAAE